MDSFYIVNDAGGFVVEKHYRGRLPKTFCNVFFEAMREYPDTVSIPSVLSVDRTHALIHVSRDRLVYLALCTTEVAPLFILELLDRIYECLLRFCGPGPITEENLKQHFTTVHLLLDEMLDFGNPATTEPNILEMLVNQPSLLNVAFKNLVYRPTKLLADLASTVGLPGRATAVSSSISGSGIAGDGDGMGGGSGFGAGGGLSGCGSEVWWRRGNVVHPANEVFVDVVERMHCTVDAKSNVASASVAGEIQINSQVSGVPELTLTIKNPEILSNASFHPSVRLSKFDKDQHLVFIPPDGEFVACTYCVHSLPSPTNISGTCGATNAAIKNSVSNTSAGSTAPTSFPKDTAAQQQWQSAPSFAFQKSLLPPVTVKGFWNVNKNVENSARLEIRVDCQNILRGTSGSVFPIAAASAASALGDMSSSTSGASGGSSVEIENVVVLIPLPNYVSSAAMSCSIGSSRLLSSAQVDGRGSGGQQLMWSIGQLSPVMGSQRMDGILSFESDFEKMSLSVRQSDALVPSELKCTATLSFLVKGWAASGIKVDTLDATNTQASPYKGCRAATLAGNVEFRLQ